MRRNAIIPYEGTNPYVFVSYAHKDSHMVMPVLERLYDMGYRIWFDDGIAPGSEWPENIAQHLNDCALTMAFVSPNSIASDNCRREVTFALSKRKPFLGIVLQRTEMSLGMEMQLSAQQCVMKYSYQSEEEFIRKVCSCPDLAPCLDEQVKANTAQEPPRAESNPAAPKESVAAAGEKKPAPVRFRQPKEKRHEKYKVRKVREKKTGKTCIKILAAVCAVVIIPLLIYGLSSVKITEDKRVSTRETFLSLSGETVTKEMADKLARLKKLEYVTFRNCTFQAGVLEEMELSGQLKEFSAIDCAGLSTLAFLQELPNLSSLTLENSGISDELLPELSMVNLRRLDLSGNSAVTSLEKIRNCPSLTELDISDTGVTTLETLTQSGMTKINFSNTKVSDVSPMAHMESLTSVQGSGTAVSNIDALASLEKLAVLNFNDCKIESVNIPFSALRMTQLRLENNGLSGLEAFADCTVLKQVWLAGNRLADVSVLEKSAATLTHLSLSGNTLEAEDLEFLENAVLMKELYLDGLDLYDPYFTDLGFAANMEDLTKLSAKGCGLTEIPSLILCEELSCLVLANNAIETTYALENLSTTATLTLDLSYNPIETLRYLPPVRYGVLALYGIAADLDTLPEVGGRMLCADYQDGLESTHLANKTFSSYYLLGCPADAKVKTEDLLGSYRILFLETDEDVIAQMEAEGLDYSFLKENQ